MEYIKRFVKWFISVIRRDKNKNKTANDLAKNTSGKRQMDDDEINEYCEKAKSKNTKTNNILLVEEDRIGFSLIPNFETIRKIEEKCEQSKIRPPISKALCDTFIFFVIDAITNDRVLEDLSSLGNTVFEHIEKFIEMRKDLIRGRSSFYTVQKNMNNHDIVLFQHRLSEYAKSMDEVNTAIRKLIRVIGSDATDDEYSPVPYFNSYIYTITGSELCKRNGVIDYEESAKKMEEIEECTYTGKGSYKISDIFRGDRMVNKCADVLTGRGGDIYKIVEKQNSRLSNIVETFTKKLDKYSNDLKYTGEISESTHGKFEIHVKYHVRELDKEIARAVESTAKIFNRYQFIMMSKSQTLTDARVSYFRHVSIIASFYQ